MNAFSEYPHSDSRRQFKETKYYMQNLKKAIFSGNISLLVIISASIIIRMYKASMEPQTFAYNVMCFLFVIVSAGVAGFAIGAKKK